MSTARHRSSPPPDERTESGAIVVARDRAPSDEALVRRALDGDRWAEEALFRRYAAQVLAMAERLLRRKGLADDVLQDTFADAFTKLDTLRDPTAFRAWLFGIAVRRVRRRQRSLAMRRALGLDRSLDDSTLAMVASNECSPERLAELGRIDRILATLPPDQRIAWMLRRVEGEKLEDIASMVGCSLATAKRRIRAADVLIRSVLGEQSP